MNLINLLFLTISFVFSENALFSYALGIIPNEKRFSHPFLKALSLLLVVLFSALLMSLCDYFLLAPFRLSAFSILVYVFAIVPATELLRFVMQKIARLFDPLFTVSSFDLYAGSVASGLALLVSQKHLFILESCTLAVGAGLGYIIAISVLDAIDKRLALEWVPPVFKGLPLRLLSAGLVSMAFMAVSIAF